MHPESSKIPAVRSLLLGPLMKLFTPVGALGAAVVLGVAFVACSDTSTLGEQVGSTSQAINPISGCDYSFARPTPASLVSMGYQFAARYLSGDPGGGKDITASEANALLAAKMDIVLVWEASGTAAMNGYNQGVSDAQAAKSEALSVGQPATRPIYFAVDFESDSGSIGSITSYFQGVSSVLGLSRTGAYGGIYTIQQLFNSGTISFGWQTYAWSSGQWDARAQLRQTQNGVDNDQLDADEGMVSDYGQWPVAGPAYGAQFVSQSFPLATTALDVVEGQTIPSYIELKNIGTATWTSDTRLATTQPENRNSVFADSTWLAADRPAAVSGTVPPGGTYKFQFNLHAPSTTGTYHEYFGVVQDGVTWFSAPGQGGPADNDLEVQVVVSAPEYRGTFVSQTYPLAPSAAAAHVGEELTGSITLTNSGTKPWIAGTTKLAPIPRDTASPFATSTWLSTSRVSTVSADVQPGQNGTFSLSLKPTSIGTFSVPLGLVEEGVSWFADAPNGGGPADGFLRVDVVVVADDVDAGSVVKTDASAEEAGTDGGITFQGIDGGTDAETIPGGPEPSADSGPGGSKKADAGRGNGSMGDEPTDPDAPGGSTGPGSSGGCSASGRRGQDYAALEAGCLLGLLVLVRRRHRAVSRLPSPAVGLPSPAVRLPSPAVRLLSP